jgi:hypothetical protein
LGGWTFRRLDESWDRVHFSRPGAPRVRDAGGFWTNQVTKIPEEWWERSTGHFVASHLVSDAQVELPPRIQQECRVDTLAACCRRSLTILKPRLTYPDQDVHTQVRTSILRPSVPNKPDLQRREKERERRKEIAEAKPTTEFFLPCRRQVTLELPTRSSLEDQGTARLDALTHVTSGLPSG